MPPQSSRICQHCGIPFAAYPSSRQHFCSRSCANSTTKRTIPDRLCAFCGNCFRPSSAKVRFCSHTCSSIDSRETLKGRVISDWHRRRISEAAYKRAPNTRLRGANHQNWKGGVGIYRRIGLEVNGRACLDCGSMATVVHHIDEDRSHNDPANLAPLCGSCHQLRHHGARYVEWTCRFCNSVIRIREAQALKRRFCSQKCYANVRKSVGMKFEPGPSGWHQEMREARA